MQILPYKQVVFEDPVVHARRCIDLLHHHHHCDLILALTHVELGTRPTTKPLMHSTMMTKPHF